MYKSVIINIKVKGESMNFKFGNANKQQKEAILSIDGPILIIAGPGTGKTFTLVKRAVYLIVEKKVLPEEIMIATFTEKAAKEIITRISNELISLGISININEMYIGTFHSICLRIIKEHLEYTRLKKNYRLLDQFEQQYIIFQHINKFRQIDNYDVIFNNKKIGVWKQSGELAHYISIISEELVELNKFKGNLRSEIKALGEVVELYNEILEEENILDFSGIQIEVFNLLKNNKEILQQLKEKIKYIMVDEYQDTNYVQEQLIFMIANKNMNICVVGDDDQGLYRFRGATIRNILEYPDKFKENQCKKIYLTKNYRSEQGIIDFYNNWMTDSTASENGFDWSKYRFKKKIECGIEESVKSPSVVRVGGEEFDDEWDNQVLAFINKLKNESRISDYNQIAFLFRSVKNDRVTQLEQFLESSGVSVYSPRSDMFFKRREVKFAIIAIMLTFPNYVADLNAEKFEFMSEELWNYYIQSIDEFMAYINDSNKKLLEWIKAKASKHAYLNNNTDYGFSGLMYELFEFEPFKSILDTELNTGVIDTRPAYNLAMLSNIIVRYEYLHRLDVFTAKNITKHTERFFNMYLRFLFDGGIDEFEDDSEYAPSGCVSFLTIHQSKGMEFPIVVVGSLSGTPRADNNQIISILENEYYHRKPFEPKDLTKYFDFWRIYYTAFSRAQNLLVLTAREKIGRGSEPSKYFRKIYDSLPYYDDEQVDLDEFKFKSVKSVNLKESYSFTSHIILYENCSLQYKFYKELGFTPVRVGATIFGSLVHQTIEDIHRAAIRNEKDSINSTNIEEWFNNNYMSIVKRERAYLAQPQKDAALKQVLLYAENQKDNWDKIKEAEVEVSLVKEDYILNGTVDLIEGKGNTVELVDFKSEKKPDLRKDREKIEQYRKQLEVYAHIVQERTGYEISKLHLYYTGEINGVPRITFDKKNESIDKTIKEFDKVVCKIKNKDFNEKSKSNKLCENCDMRFYCK